MTQKIIIRCLFSLALFIGIFLFLWLRCPQYLLYQEQYQLFLFTRGYFLNSIAVPGGMADYVSEFIVQFYYVPLYGALMAALTLTISQIFLGLACRKCEISESLYALAAIPSILYVGAMGDENVLFSYAVAMVLTSLFILLDSLRRQSSLLIDTIITIIGFAILYWLAGPIAVVYIIAVGILRRQPLAIAIALSTAFVIVWEIHTLWLEQYPLSRLLFGINYYRVPEVYPTLLFIIAAFTSLLPLLTLTPKMKIGQRTTDNGQLITIALVALFAIIYIPASFNKEKSRIIEYDALVRRGDWSGIISKAQAEKPSDSFSLQALNLALGMTGQLTDKMFQYDQKGIESLIDKNRLDNTSPLVTAEILYRLGLTNIAFSTTFDIQEAIMNDRKSGRFMKRMAECMIINGNYKVAEKYIGMLRNSFYYASWASHAETLLHNDHDVETHQVYGPLRRNAFKQVAFYDHTQIDKILAMQAIGSEGRNGLAWQYYCASALLKGDLATLVGVYNHSADKFSQGIIPRHIQEAIAMYWTFSHNTFEGIPFQISGEVKRQTSNLAQAVMRNQDDASAWQAAAPGSYGVYFLINSRKNQNPAPTENYQPTHE